MGESTDISLTASPSFRLRIQRSEESRALLMAGVYLVYLGVVTARRLTGGVVMASDVLFGALAVVFVLGLAYQSFVWARLRRANAASTLVARWRLDATVVVELAVACLGLLAMYMWSPRGQYAALSGPLLLVLPLTVMVSVLRLRPVATLCLGLAAAAVHVGLVLDTIRTEQVEWPQVPVLLGYGVLLAATGVAGMLVTRAARRYVAEAAQEAVDLERAADRLRKVDRDLQVARDIQAGLLPREAPDFPGFEFAGMNVPAEKTGGDYYDWQPMPDGRVLVVMADVTGHGIAPAMVMAICRAYARASAPIVPDLGFLLDRLNALLAADLRGARFITLAVALMDGEGRAQLLSAGHGPSMLYRAATGGVEQFGGDGLPLAVMADEKYGPIRAVDIGPGDVLVMLTDGLFEWCNASGKQFGTARVAAALAASAAAGKGAGEIMRDLHGAAVAYASGAAQEDDLTIVVVKRSAGG